MGDLNIVIPLQIELRRKHIGDASKRTEADIAMKVMINTEHSKGVLEFTI